MFYYCTFNSSSGRGSVKSNSPSKTKAHVPHQIQPQLLTLYLRASSSLTLTSEVEGLILSFIKNRENGQPKWQTLPRAVG